MTEIHGCCAPRGNGLFKKRGSNGLIQVVFFFLHAFLSFFPFFSACAAAHREPRRYHVSRYYRKLKICCGQLLLEAWKAQNEKPTRRTGDRIKFPVKKRKEKTNKKRREKREKMDEGEEEEDHPEIIKCPTHETCYTLNNWPRASCQPSTKPPQCIRCW